MTDLLRVKKGDPAPATLETGEIALDEALRLLFTDTGGVPAVLPLDIAPLPAASGLLSEICVQTSDGPVYAALSAGAGGRPFDSKPWRVPGVTGVDMGTLDLLPVSIYVATIEIGAPSMLLGLRVDALSADTVTFGLRDHQGGSILEVTHTGSGGLIEAITGVLLPPGRYQTFVSTTAGASFRTLLAALPWSTEPVPFPVFLRFA